MAAPSACPSITTNSTVVTDHDHPAPRGSVFWPDPVTSSGDSSLNWDAPDAVLQAQCVDVELAHLLPPQDGVYHLRSRHVHTVTRRPPPLEPPTSVSGDFRVGVRDPGFLFVMAYHWLDALAAHVYGLQIDALADADHRPIWVDPLGPDGRDNSHFSPAHPDGPRIVLGLGAVPDASDPAVLSHEYGHALHHLVLGPHGVTPWEEGFNDFLATCWLDRFNESGHARHEVFPWDNNPSVRWDDWRRVDVSERFDDPDYADYDHYLLGNIWASTLWEGYLALGGDAPDAHDRKAAADAMIAGYLTTLAQQPADSGAADLALGLTAQVARQSSDKHPAALHDVFSARGLEPT